MKDFFYLIYYKNPSLSMLTPALIYITLHLKEVDLSNIVEVEDETDLSGELACAGGACEIT